MKRKSLKRTDLATSKINWFERKREGSHIPLLDGERRFLSRQDYSAISFSGKRPKIRNRNPARVLETYIVGIALVVAV